MQISYNQVVLFLVLASKQNSELQTSLMCMTTSDGSSGLVEYIGICEISSYIVDSYGHQGL